MKRQTAGFGIIEVIIAIVVLALLVGGGWYVWQAQQTKHAPAAQTSIAKTDPYADWLTYIDSVSKFSVKHPKDWQITTKTSNQGSGSDYPITDTVLISPRGTKLTLRTNYGGKGGMCEPAPNDKPFQAGNVCPSEQYVYAEKLDVGGIYKARNEGDKKIVDKANLYLVAKELAWGNDKPAYTLGLIDSVSDIKLNEPVMGFVLSDLFLTLFDANGHYQYNIEVYATSSDKAFLTNDEGEAVKKILRSFTL
jgi:hypothetical protein